MLMNPTYNLLKKYYKGSKRYFISSLSFPSEYREKVAIVYNFCRLVDNSVDEAGKAEMSFADIRDDYYKCLETDLCTNDTVKLFVKVLKENNIQNKWIEALFSSMQMDLERRKYISINETLEYVYGVAEVIGLMMCQILEIDAKAHKYAMALGRAAQWINFIRDISEDYSNGRVYFPENDLKLFHIRSFNRKEVMENKDNFIEFINFQSKRFYEWVNIAESGYKYIPNNVRNPIIYSTELDKWKMSEILKNPLLIYEKKFNPSTKQIVREIIKIKISGRT